MLLRRSWVLGSIRIGRRIQKVAPLAGLGIDADLPGQELRQVTRDRQAQTGAAVLARVAAIDLAELLEDDLLLLWCDARAVVGDADPDAILARVGERKARSRPPVGENLIALERKL